MTWPGKHLSLLVFAAVSAFSAAGQAQSCPVNINFSDGTVSHWRAYTGNNKDGNGPGAIRLTYDYSHSSTGPSALPEYNLPNVDGVTVITRQSTDPFGDFPTI